MKKNKKENKKNKLTDKQKLFCEQYTSKDTYMNWTRSYMEVYPRVSEKTARTNASRMLTNANIMEYIESLLVEVWINESMLDFELKKLIVQDIDKSAKLQAIKHWNDLLTRIEKARQKALDEDKITKDVITIKLPE